MRAADEVHAEKRTAWSSSTSGGRQLTSPQFAEFLGTERDRGTGHLVFAIGGSYGFSEAFRSRAAKTLALSRMTFTHQMVRVFLLEQIYRGFTILNNEPYHH